MLIWLASHAADLIVIAVIAAAVFFVVRGMIRDKKAGKPSCGGSCAGCGACAGCAGCSSCSACAAGRIKKQNT